MTAVATQAGAVSRVVNWHAINWQRVHQNVNRLQARMVKATQENRWGKVKALQRVLTHSFSGKAVAVRRVTENRGKKTPGVDRILWETPEKKGKAIQELKQRGYHALPLRRVYIKKSNGQRRPLGIPGMHERAMQALYLLAIDPIAETMGDKNSYGFRKERSTADAIEQCFNVLGKKTSPIWILEGDIRACFDKINHDWLLADIPMEKTILKKWLRAGYMEQGFVHPTKEGTPQGGICSPVLANLALDDLERELKERFPKTTQRGRWASINLIRYADDFVITGRTKELLEEEVKPLVKEFLRPRGMELSEEKTRVTHIQEGFNFLGQNVRKYSDKLLIKPSRENVKKFLGKVRKLIKANSQATAGALIEELNPDIKGWANYHRHVVSGRTFQEVDTKIFKALWRWAKGRHPQKGARWIKKKYFRRQGGYSWSFFGEVKGKKGKEKKIDLFRAAQVPIRRHIKIKSEANPYDPQWESYFDQRLAQKWLQGKKRTRLTTLWKEQAGNCPICYEKITRESGWNMHHIIHRVHGGDDRLMNLILLHPNCHRQVHNQSWKVVKPGPEKGLRKA